jgi:signal peptidase I
MDNAQEAAGEDREISAAPEPAETGGTKKDQTEKREQDDFTELVKAMFFAAIIALLIRSFLFEPFNIPSGSMFPTLLVGDYLFVEKYSYGYSKYSFPLDVVSFDGRIMGRPVTRGDVVVFRQPKRPDIDYIKRIIGLPGDTIQVKEGRLYINGKIVPREPVGIEVYDDEGGKTPYHKYVETLPGGVKHFIYEVSDNEALDNTDVYKVPQGYYFAMGDNRDRSLDSRVQADVGYVPAENLIGRAALIFFSTEGVGDKCEREGFLAAVRRVGCDIYEGGKAVRYGRLFTHIQGG